MGKLIALGAMVLLMGLAMAAEAMPVGPDDADGHAFPGKRVIEAQGATFGGALQAPAITSAADSITAAGTCAVFSAPLQEP